jgi:V/A-type H+-transporting ATPase subunit I
VIVKMKFLSITGPKADIDRVVNNYLSKYEIHLENALSELKSVQSLTPYLQINPYKELLGKANDFCELIPNKDTVVPASIKLEDSIDLVTELDKKLIDLSMKRSRLEEKRDKLADSMKTIQPFRDLHYNLSTILDFKFIRFRFGKIAKEYYQKFESYVYDNFDTVFYRCAADEEYVWGVYFTPKSQVRKVDAVYSSMHFERVFIPDEYTGTPGEAFQHLEQAHADVCRQLSDLETQMQSTLIQHQEKLLGAQDRLSSLSKNFDVRRVAACTKEDHDTFYILCGWMAAPDVASFQKDIENDPNLFCIVEDDDNNICTQPPTKLKNPKIFKPFEMFVRMYGLPNYNEIDPTIFVGLTYAFIFGCMFGDAGQGLCLAIGGFLLYKFKKMDLAAIVGTAGIFSTFFGFMFGSIFGFEDIIPALWLRPVNSMMEIPFIGKLNTVFILAIGFGMFLILITMIMHIINGLRAHDPENTWFDTNGLAGLVFYGAIVATIVLFVSGQTLPAAVILIVMFVIPLLVIFFKEPLTHAVEKKAEIMPKEKGMFFVQGFFELFEVLLSYFSNTLSFVRIGAFAVSHAAMMEVVLMLAGAEAGSPNWIVVVLGNLFVMGMEGLIVGIQVLRLEYYEMFSRFYKGSGKEFKPFLKKTTKH